MHFLQWKLLVFDLNLIKGHTQGYCLQQIVVASVNGLSPDQYQAISRTNDDPVHWHIYVSPGLSELTPSVMGLIESS